MTASSLSGTASSVTVASGNTLTLSSGAQVSGLDIESGGIVKILAGASVMDGSVETGGVLSVSAGGTAENLDIAVSGRVNISSGGIVTGASLDAGALLYVYSGGVSSDSIGGIQVSSGGLSVDGTATSGAAFYIFKGAEASGTVVTSSGIIRLSAGGTATDTTVKSGGYLWVSSGGVASGADIVTSGGYIGVSSGGSATDVTINGGSGRISGIGTDYTLTSGAYLWISAGGVLSGATFDTSAYAMMSSGALTEEVTVENGATLYVSAGAKTVSTTVLSGGSQQVAGETDNAVISSGGIDILASGAIGSGDTIASGGVGIVSSGASVTGETVLTGGQLVLIPGATATGLINEGGDIISAAALLTSSGQFVSAFSADDLAKDSLPVDSGLTLDVYAGANLTSAQEQGTVLIETGATATGDVLSAGAGQDVFGQASGTVVQSGSTEIVETGGLSVSGTVQSGGIEQVSGQVSGFSVLSGASLNVSADGIAQNDIISSGAIEIICSGGSAVSETIASGATLVVMDGASVSGLLPESGSQIISGTVVLTSNGGALSAAADVMSDPSVGSGATVTVYDGGETLSASLDLNGSETVLSGGIASATQGGNITVLSGGLLTGGTQLSETYDYISAGGDISGVTIGDSATLRIWSGGQGEDLTAVNGGLIWQHSGIVSGVLLESGGYLGVSAGAIAIDVDIEGGSGRISGLGSDYTLNSGGYVWVSAAGILETATFEGAASAFISSGGLIDSASVTDGSVLYVSAGATTSDTDVGSGGVQQIGGTTVNALIGDGGTDFLTAGALASGNTVQSGGIEVASSGATVISETVGSGGTLLVLDGAKVSGTVNAGGNVVSAGVYVTSGTAVVSVTPGTLSGLTIDNVYESAAVLPGGEVDDATITAGAVLQVLSGSLASGTVDGSVVTVAAGGQATATTVEGRYATQTVSGTATGTVIGSGGAELTVQGATTSGAIVQAGGTEQVTGTAQGVTTSAGGLTEILSGGAGQNDLIASGGFEIVSAGGAVTSETIASGGTLVLESGASATDLTLEDGGQIVSAGVLVVENERVTSAIAGTASGLTLDDYNADGEILSGGATDAAVIGEYAMLSVSAGGVAHQTQDSGDVEVLSGGLTDGTVVSSLATETIRSGGLASGTQILADGEQYISAGGTAIGTQVASGATQTIFGTASATTVGAGGTADVHGAILSATITSGARLTVASGATATGDTLLSGAIEVVSSGAQVSGEIVASGATLIVLDGGEADSIGSQGGTVVTSGVIISSGGVILSGIAGTASGLVLDGTNGDAIVQQGGEADDTIISGASTLFIEDGSLTSGSIVSGSEVVDVGGTAQASQIEGGLQTVSGTALDAVVGQSGQQAIDTTGAATGTTVQSGGTVLDSGTLSDADEQTGGVVMVLSGASASGNVIGDGAIEVVSAGGTATGEELDEGGTLIVMPGANVTDTTLAGGLVVSSGEVFYDDTTPVSATTAPIDGAVLSAGISAIVLSGGATITTLIEDGATLSVLGGGLAADTTVSGDLNLASGAGAAATLLLSGGTETLASGATDSATILNSGSFQDVRQGGVTVSAQVWSGASQSVYGVAENTAVIGGEQYVYGTADETILLAGAVQYIAPGSTSATLSSANSGLTATGGGGAGSPGYAERVDIESGASQFVGGAASTVIVEAGGVQTIGSVGLVRGDLIAGTATVSSGGTLDGAIIASGGTLVLSSGAAAEDVLLRSGSTIDLVDMDYTSATALQLSGGFELTISAAGQTMTIDLDGTYDAASFALSGDTGSGTLLSVVQDGTPCYCRGTLITTEHGEIPVEQLSIGDHVITAENGPRPIRWIGRRSYSGQFARGNRDILPVVFRKGSLGNNLPTTDLSVSPLHAMFLDGVLVPAVTLVNGTSIVQAECMDEVAYFHIELDSHDLVLANGAPSETFIDDGSRGMFHNAAEYATLYPDASTQPATYCAPRVEHGAGIERIRSRLNAPAADGSENRPEDAPLLGYLDLVSRTRIEGWARTEGASQPVRLHITDRGVVLGEVIADQPRPDAGGAYGFTFLIPGGLSPFRRHVIEVRRVSDRAALKNTPWMLDQTASGPTRIAVPVTPSETALEGYVDFVTRDRIGGWAWTPETPDEPVALQILDNGNLIAAVVANGIRQDVSGTGRGLRCGFDVLLPEGLPPFTRHVIEVRRENDGALLGAPVTLEPVNAFDQDAEDAIRRVVTSAASLEGQDRVLSFLLGQVDQLTRIRVRTASGETARALTSARRRRGLPAGTPAPRRHALIIDGMHPDINRDAGSCAVLAHARALITLGYEVSFVAADQMSGGSPSTQIAGITMLTAPLYSSVEDVLAKHADIFDVVYLHRQDIATRYMALVRRYQRSARVLYNVADLHHVRTLRQAGVQKRPELIARARSVKHAEYTAALQADAVLVHSPEEAKQMQVALPQATIHVVPWSVSVRPEPKTPMERNGLVFLGNYSHEPNVDAAFWLVRDIMPLVWKQEPSIRCLLAGADMSESIRALERHGVGIVGHAPDLDTMFSEVRLSVSPLRFGAGIKGKVLESFARGVPCVMTPVAAEGLNLPETLAGLVACDPETLAAQILVLHREGSSRCAHAREVRNYVRRNNDASTVAERLRAILEPGQVMRALS
ncbi:Hint domain-containing protein [Acetobacter fallax]|nr:Hint domain-containing protein [Acetobacter fallax]